LDWYYHYFLQLLDKGVPLVTHNGYAFDEPMFDQHMTGYSISDGFSCGDNGMFDTHCLEKATQAPKKDKVIPWKGDTLREYFGRVHHFRFKGVQSSMDVCFDRYEFARRFGLDKRQQHTAVQDAFCCHLLMEEYRKMLVRQPVAEFVPDAQPRQRPSTNGSTRRRGQRNN
jgi:hypothetical protein